MARFLADRQAKQVHDILYQEPECLLEEMPLERQRWFASLPDAHVAGNGNYGNCRLCIGRAG